MCKNWPDPPLGVGEEVEIVNDFGIHGEVIKNGMKGRITRIKTFNNPDEACYICCGTPGCTHKENYEVELPHLAGRTRSACRFKRVSGIELEPLEQTSLTPISEYM
jgi:hypothetical protein